MEMGKVNINIYSLISSALFFAIFKPYFLPEGIRILLKIGILILVFFFLISNLNLNRLLNHSLIFCACVVVSAVVAKINGNYSMKSLLDSILYALTFYDLYTFAQLCKIKDSSDKLLFNMYMMNLIYCILTIASILVVGVENNSNRAAYLFGNKFTSMYLFILLIALFGATHDMNIKRNRIILFVISIFSFLLSIYLDCATATISLLIILVIFFLPNKFKKYLINEKVVVIALIMSALIIIWIEVILKTSFISRLVTEYFGKSYTVAGRLEIYSVYLGGVLRERFWLGHGYSSSVMLNKTGVFSNAQNGMLEIFVSFGIVGVIALIFTVYYCYKHSGKKAKTFYLSLVIYGMIIAAIFEVTINWFFLLGLCLIRWNSSIDREIQQKVIKIRF